MKSITNKGRRQFLASSAAAMASTAVTAHPASDKADRQERDGASEELIRFMSGLFAAKTAKDLDKTMSYFSPHLVTYTDATLGWDVAGFAALRAVFSQYMPQWPATARSYPTKIHGDMTHGCLVAFTDSPELFGGEIRAIGSISFQEGKIVRWVDHWNWNGFDNLFNLQKNKLQNFKEWQVSQKPSALVSRTIERIFQAMSSGDAKQFSALFHPEGSMDDTALRLHLRGRLQIERFIAGALDFLPYGRGSSATISFGKASGGFEWSGSSATNVYTGATMLSLNDDGAITNMSMAYDASLLADSQVQRLAELGVGLRR